MPGLMRFLGHLLTFVLLGTVLGAGVASLVAPGIVEWYNVPGGSTPALCQCDELVRSVSQGLLRAQLIGATIGAVLMPVIGFSIGAATRRPRRIREEIR